MPEEYGVLNHVVPVGTDPAQIPKTFKDYDDSLTAELLAFPPSQLATAGAGDEGKLLIVQNTGDAVFKALSGDVTVDAAGAVTIGTGKVTAGKLGSKAVETAKLNDKAVTLGKLAEALGLTEGYFADGAVGAAKLATSAKDLFLQLVGEQLGLAVRFGSFTKAGLGQSTYQNVTHELGKQPQWVFPAMANAQYQTNVTADNYGETTFRLGAYRVDGGNIGTLNVAYLAVG